MKIAYNPKTAAALTSAPANNDITFDLSGLSIYVKGERFKGTDTTYTVFKKHSSGDSGGYNGLVPVPDYNNNSLTRYLREDGTWLYAIDVQLSETTTTDFRPVVLGLTHSATLTELVNPVTGQVYITSKIYACPSTGILYATKLYSNGKEVLTEHQSLANYVTLNTAQSITGTKTFTNPINSSYCTNSHLAGNLGKTLINSTATAGSYVMLFKGNSTNGYFTHGVYLTKYLLQYTTKSTVTEGTNSITKSAVLLDESGDSLFPGNITALKFIGKIDWSNIEGKPSCFTPCSHTHSTALVTTLTSYTKATSNSALSTSDSLNLALGKLEYKGDLGVTAYSLINAAYDGDGTIENLKEILKVLEGIKDTDTIKGLLGKYLPLSGGTMTGPIKFNGDTSLPSKTLSYVCGVDTFASGGEMGYMSGSSFVSQYAPTKTGTGASGTWGISITGNAATATNADKIDKYHVSNLIGGVAQANHGSQGTEYTPDTYSSTFVDKSFAAYAERGSWAYANNGYISTDLNLNIPLAGTAIFQWGASDTNKTQLYITPGNHSVTNGVVNEMLFYSSNGNDYAKTWTRVLTHRNYNSFAPTLTGGGASGTWGISISGTAKRLANYYSARPTSANIAPLGDGGMVKFIVSSSMTTGKPTYEGHIIHLFWDSTSGWDSQLSIPATSNSSAEPQFRQCNNGTWGDWINLITSNTIGSYNAGSATNADMLDGIHFQNILEREYSGASYFGTNTATDTGWKRIAETKLTDSGGQSFILSISRQYGHANNESYLFSINIAYNGGISITQLSGYANSRIITKIRVDYKPSNIAYIDFYVGSSSASNQYHWYTVGNAKSYTSAIANPTLVGTTYEFTTVNGCKSDRGFTGDITGNATSATKLKTAQTIWGHSFDGTTNVSGSLSNTGTITASSAATYDIGSNVLDYRNGYFRWIGAKSNTNLRLAANNSDNQIVLHTNGNVGIGTNSPGYKLDISGHVHASDWYYANTNYGFYINSGVYYTDILKGYPEIDSAGNEIVFGSNSNILYVNYRTSRLRTTAVDTWIWRAGSSTSWANFQLGSIESNGDITATSFKKNGSSDSYVLLGGGGHKLISDFATAAGLFTNLSNTSDNKISITVGGTNKTLTVGYANKSEFVNLVDSITVTNLLMSADDGYTTVKRWTGSMGSYIKPIWIQKGVPTECGSTGDPFMPIYLSSEGFKAAKSFRLNLYKFTNRTETDSYIRTNTILTVSDVLESSLFVTYGTVTVTLPEPTNSLVGTVLFFKSGYNGTPTIECVKSIVSYNMPMSNAGNSITLSNNGSAIFVCMKYVGAVRWVLFWCGS